MKQIEVSQREGEAAEEDMAIGGVAQTGYYHPGTSYAPVIRPSSPLLLFSSRSLCSQARVAALPRVVRLTRASAWS